jgi:NADH-quinone oxidoreductase subunit J
MTALFYIAAAVAVIATVLVITRSNLVHALLYLVVSLFAVAVVFFSLGAPFVAALEVIVYAGAIMMLFVFAVMLLNVRAIGELRVPGRSWAGPLILAAVLLAEVVYGVTRAPGPALNASAVGPETVSRSLFGPYVLGVELASMLLLVALLGARHVAGQRGETSREPATGDEPHDDGAGEAQPHRRPGAEEDWT